MKPKRPAKINFRKRLAVSLFQETGSPLHFIQAGFRKRHGLPDYGLDKPAEVL
jgi:hypothetical protein